MHNLLWCRSVTTEQCQVGLRVQVSPKVCCQLLLLKLCINYSYIAAYQYFKMISIHPVNNKTTRNSNIYLKKKKCSKIYILLLSFNRFKDILLLFSFGINNQSKYFGWNTKYRIKKNELLLFFWKSTTKFLDEWILSFINKIIKLVKTQDLFLHVLCAFASRAL